MKRILQCDACAATYDVTEREPGKKVRCRRCVAGLVVPAAGEGGASGAGRTTSSRLRIARPPACAQHPQADASALCAACGALACAACLAPAPVDHFCAACARARGLDGALKLDFGPVVTLRLAWRLFRAGLGRALLWKLLVVVCALAATLAPGYVGGRLWLAQGPDSGLGLLGGLLVIGSALAYTLLSSFVLFPAGCALLYDDLARGRSVPLGAALQAAAHRVLRSALELGLLLVVYFVLGLLALAPALGLAAVVPEAAAPLVLLLVGGPALFALFAATALAVPVRLLEERPAAAALVRSLELVRQRPAEVALLALAYGLACAALVLPFQLLRWPLETALALLAVDLFAPALLVASYHGLAAEHAGVLGRG